jgi:hypothetical protein
MPETLYLTVNLIDRFLEAKQVTRKHLQLVGVTAMLVASKYEEIWAPEVGAGVGAPSNTCGSSRQLDVVLLVTSEVWFTPWLGLHAPAYDT